MKQRVVTGIMIFAVLVLVIFARSLSIYIFDAFILVLAVIGAYEMSNMLAKMNCYNNKYIVYAYPGLSYAVYLLGTLLEMKWYMTLLMELSLLVIVIGFLALYGIINSKATKNEIITRNLKIKVDTFSIYKALHTMFACVYPTLLLFAFIIMNNFAHMSKIFIDSTENLAYISTFAIVLTFSIPVFADTFAYLTGSLFKGPKLCPKISPNKTISGAIGGTIWAMVGSVLVYLIFNAMPTFSKIFTELNLAFWQFLIVGFVGAVVCILGDLFESYLKRKADLKDSGNLLPGHGGILDRIDSHLFCAPIVLIFFIIVL